MSRVGQAIYISIRTIYDKINALEAKLSLVQNGADWNQLDSKLETSSLITDLQSKISELASAGDNSSAIAELGAKITELENHINVRNQINDSMTAFETLVSDYKSNTTDSSEFVVFDLITKLEAMETLVQQTGSAADQQAVMQQISDMLAVLNQIDTSNPETLWVETLQSFDSAAFDASVADLKSKVSTLIGSVDQFADINAKIAELRTLLSGTDSQAIQSKFEELKSAVDSAGLTDTVDLNNVSLTDQAQNDLITDLTNRVSALESSINSINSVNITVETRLSNIEQLIQNSLATNADLQVIKDECTSLTNQINNIASESAELTAKMDELSTQAAQLTTKIGVLTDQTQSNVQLYLQQNNFINAVNTQLITTKNEFDALIDSLAQLEDLIPHNDLTQEQFENYLSTNLNSYANINFAGINFHGEFYSVDFTGCNFTAVNSIDQQTLFSSCILSNADFSGLDLTGMNFEYSTLDSANFSNANLTNANFNYADLTNVNFEGAILDNVNFEGSNYPDAPVEETSVEQPAESAPVDSTPVEQPAEETPVDSTPVEQPAEETPVESAPVESAPVESAPVEQPAEETPVEETPVDSAPVEEAPIDSAPVEQPVEETPVDSAPVEEAPAEQPVEETPVDSAPVEQPAEETPVEQPVEETPVDSAPVEQPAEETPVEQPVEETPVDSAPVEEAPIEQPADSTQSDNVEPVIEPISE
jgi:uncharacterized protein YjbI with pentapeptide repeats